MKLYLETYIEKLLKTANYEFDESTKSWCASVDKLPGAYAQADTIEEVRNELAEVIEDYIFVSLYERQTLPNFKKNISKSYAKTTNAQRVN
jgi:predicted RNase H-like HicB family nuclease